MKALQFPRVVSDRVTRLERAFPARLPMALRALGIMGAGCALLQVGRRVHRRRQNLHLDRGKVIVVLGSGFGGLSTAEELARLLPSSGDAHIVLIDQHDYLIFTPMLTEAAGGELDTHHIVRSTHHLDARIHYVQARVDQIDAAGKCVYLTVGTPEQNTPESNQTLRADHLVIGLGGVNNFRGVPGAEQNALTLKTLLDAALVRNRTLAMLSRADAEADPAVQRGLLTFVVVGGGYTGVETMAALNGLIRDEAPHFPRIASQNIRTLLIHSGDRLLPELSPGLAAYARKKLEERGVEVRLGFRITAVHEDAVELGMERVPTRMVIWTTGGSANPIVKNSHLPLGSRGGISVDATCAVPGFPGIWSVGDCAEIPQHDQDGVYAPTAQNARREGVQVARNIVAVLRGQQPKPFRYTPIGELAVVGKRSGVARIYGLQFSGVSAWVMWRAIYWAKLPNFAQRMRVLADWTLDFFFGRHIAVLPGARSQRRLTASD